MWNDGARGGGSSRLVRIGLFGGVTATDDDGGPVDVGPPKCQAVLAALALSPGHAVPVSRLAGMVWGDDPPRTADKTLQSYVTRLRKALGPDAVVRTGAAYRLDVPADAVDVARFRRQLEAGNVEAALAEWTGTPLAGLDADGLAAAVDGLVEQWLGAVEADLEHRVATDPSAAVGPLTELTATHPFREGLWALLMTALYRTGRQAEALAAFRTARRHLVDELGVEPAPRLQELEARILQHDQRLRGNGPQPGGAPARPTGTVTFGFCEVEDSAELWEAHSHKAAAVLARLDRLVRAVADRHGGSVFAAAASYGVAFERAGQAAAWATALQEAVSSEPWPGGVDLRVRVGLHTGEIGEDCGYFGAAANTAHRLAAAGHGDQTLVSAATAGLLDRSDLRELGTYRLDGVVGQQRVLQLGGGRHPPLRSADRRRGNLPAPAGRLIGRDHELGTVAEALATSPVVTLVGPGGIGKTRLALAAARTSHADPPTGGTWLVELAEISSSDEVPRAVADTLGVQQRPGLTLTRSIVAVLRPHPALLVVDNCEHVVDGVAELVEAVARGCPDVRVLATSREALGLAVEHVVVVHPLDAAGAGVELFNERAATISETFDPDASRDNVAEICRRLDGVPLAIELAAARTTTMSPADLVERLGDRLRLLTGGRRTSPQRHRTLRAAIQWSYDLLTPPEQVLLQRLSLFAGPFDLTGAETVAAGDPLDAVEVDVLVGRLVERSMLMVESGPFGRRLRLLETIRHFAANHLAVSGDPELVAHRHAQWCLDSVTRIRQLLSCPGEIEGVARLDELWPNLRAAFDWACAAGDRTLAFALVRPVALEGALRHRHEVGDWAERILAMTPPDDQQRIAFALTWAAQRAMTMRDAPAYERLVRRYGEPDHPLVRYARASVYSDEDTLVEWAPKAARAMRRQGDHYLAEYLQVSTAGALLSAGRFAEHQAVATELVDRYRAHGPPTFLHWTLIMLAYAATFQGNYDQAEKFSAESASVEIPDRTLSVSKPIEARAAFRRGHRTQAFRTLRSYLDDLLERDDLVGAPIAAIEFVHMMVTIDRHSEAACILAYLETTGSWGGLSTTTLLAEAADTIVATGEQNPQQVRCQPDLNDRQAAGYMRGVLDELAGRRNTR